MNVFISYSTGDGSDFALRLYDSLTGRGIEAWLDRHRIEPGEDFYAAIDGGIREAQVMVVVLTPGSVLSLQVKSEWNNAVNRHLPIIPLLVADCEIPPMLTLFHWIDFRHDYQQGLETLLSRLDTVSEDHLTELKKLLDAYEKAELQSPNRYQTYINRLQSAIAALMEPGSPDRQQRITAGIEEERERMTRAAFDNSQPQKVIGTRPGDIYYHFLDRENEQTLLSAWLADPASHIICVIGRGGIGKTALVSKVLIGLEHDEWPHTDQPNPVGGIVYLSTLTTGISLERIFLSCADLLGGEKEKRLKRAWISPQTTIRDKVQTLLEALNGSIYIVYLDNFEDLQTPDGDVTDPDLKTLLEMVGSVPNSLRILMTSRIPLPNKMKVSARVLPMQDGLPVEDAIKMLVDLDQLGETELHHTPVEKLRKAVELVKCIPRALEVIASILINDPFTTLDDILEVSRFVANEDVAHALIEDGYRHLDVHSRHVIEALSVFKRPTSLAGIEFLLQPFVPGLDVPAVVRRLSHSYMVSIDKQEKTVILNPIDQNYAYSRIPDDGPYSKKTLELRAAAYYEQIAVQAWVNITSLEPLFRQFEHLLRAEAYETALALVEKLEPQLLLWGHTQRVLSMRQQLVDKLVNPEFNLGRMGKCYHSLGLYREAIPVYEQALAFARSSHNARSEGNWLEGLGDVYQSRGEYDQAIKCYTRALSICRETGDRSNEGQLLANLGRAYRDFSQCQVGIDYLQQSLEIARELREQRHEGNRLGSLGSIYLDIGQHEKARQCFEQALAIARALNDRRWEAVHLGRLGELHRITGDYEQAIDQQQKGLSIAVEIGAKNVEGFLLESLGHTYGVIGNTDFAIDSLKKALKIAVDLQNEGHYHRRATLIAQAYLFSGRLRDALRAISDARHHTNPHHDIFTLTLHGVICVLLGDDQMAAQLFNEATAVAGVLERYQDQYTHALLQAGMALLATNLNQRELFLERTREAYRKAVECCNKRGVITENLRLLNALAQADALHILDGIREEFASIDDQTPVEDHPVEEAEFEYVGSFDDLIEPSIEAVARKLARVSRIRVKQHLTTGQSGAVVLLVDVDARRGGKEPSGPHYLKVHSDTTMLENVPLMDALASTAIGSSIPRIVDHVMHENLMAVLYKPALGGLSKVFSLADVLNRDVEISRQQISHLCGLLQRWNANATIRTFQPHVLVTNTLGPRGVYGDESVQKRVKRVLDISDDTILLLFGGKYLLPNPLTFLSHTSLWTGRNMQAVAVPVGHMHGDLHSGNVVCLAGHDPDILDFVTYRHDGLVFFDFAYLEFDILNRIYPLHDRAGRIELLNFIPALFEDVSLSGSLRGGAWTHTARDLIRPIRDAVLRFFDTRRDDFETAYWLAAYCVGLNFARKRVRTPDKTLNLFGVMYAAAALKKILDYFDIPHESELVPSIPWIDRVWA